MFPKIQLLLIYFLFIFYSCKGEGKSPFFFFPSSESPSVHGIVLKESGKEYPSGSTFVLGNVVRNTQGQSIQFKLVNQGSSVVNIGEGSIIGTNASEFLLISPSLTSALDPGDYKEFEIKFSPDNNLGVKTGIFTINSDDPVVGNYSLKLTGTSIPAPAPRIEVKISSTILTDNSSGSQQNFSTRENTQSTPKTVTVKNTGNLNLNLNNPIDIQGSDNAYFSVTQPSKTTLAPSESTTFTIKFNPNNTTVRNAIAQIYTDDPNIPIFRILLEGTGTPTPVPKIEITYVNNSSITENATLPGLHSFNFGSIFPNSSSASKTFIIKNVGDIGTTLNITGAEVSNSTNFTVSSISSLSLTKNNGTDPATTFTVTFNPNSIGNQTATLTISSTNGASGNISNNTVELSGVGGKRDVLLSWTSSKEKGVHQTGGGYTLCYKKTSSFNTPSETGVSCLTVPYISGPYAPNSVTATLSSAGTYYFRVRAYSEKNTAANFSTAFTLTVTSPGP
ncbi:choice-of-anchor D domain-containing protein [Leptospira selangorensis]|uniref:Choice-of-anchor D domain-containing protein n=1 Tax=Leptospira selangorensis TaxID=2484982 RepID=A0A5F2C3V8_9LEPT|nr:choice-of-anchor D domain-containing protein [Leptospira selangorensis]TGM11211.1 choice-of-anchor D domain-containing protein [Leptospira selangorensis]TGM23036.1 choice-of-anchor D domain-containing protein [Leptospira selangorensis]